MSGKNAKEAISSKEVKVERKLDTIIRMREDNLSFNNTLAGQLEDVLRRLTGESWCDESSNLEAVEVENYARPPSVLDKLKSLEDDSHNITIKISSIVERLEQI